VNNLILYVVEILFDIIISMSKAWIEFCAIPMNDLWFDPEPNHNTDFSSDLELVGIKSCRKALPIKICKKKLLKKGVGVGSGTMENNL